MARKKINYQDLLKVSPGQQESLRKYMEMILSPETPRQMFRAWLASLPPEELEKETAWIQALSQARKPAS